MITMTFFVVSRCFNHLVLKSRLNRLYTLIFLLARLKITYALFLGFPGGSVVKKLPAVQEIQVQSRGWEDPLREEMAASSSILAWESHAQRSLAGHSPWGCRCVGHNLETKQQQQILYSRALIMHPAIFSCIMTPKHDVRRRKYTFNNFWKNPNPIR